MARTAFDATKPDPATQAGTAFGNSAQANDAALRDAAVSGQMEGFLFSQTVGTGSASQPQYFYWKNGTTWIRATNTWDTSGNASNGNLTSQLWELSTNSGGAYDTIDTQGRTYDASGNLTASTGGGGMLDWILAKMCLLKTVIAGLAAHIALTGTSAHGLGTMSTQAASAVAVTGGTINGATVGATTPAAVNATNETETSVTETVSGVNAGVTIDWANGCGVMTNNGTNALTFTNVPASGRRASRMLRVSNLNNTTFPAAVTWGAGGKPSLAVVTWVNMWTVDGGTTVYAAVGWNA